MDTTLAWGYNGGMDTTPAHSTFVVHLARREAPEGPITAARHHRVNAATFEEAEARAVAVPGFALQSIRAAGPKDAQSWL